MAIAPAEPDFVDDFVLDFLVAFVVFDERSTVDVVAPSELIDPVSFDAIRLVAADSVKLDRLVGNETRSRTTGSLEFKFEFAFLLGSKWIVATILFKRIVC